MLHIFVLSRVDTNLFPLLKITCSRLDRPVVTDPRIRCTFRFTKLMHATIKVG